MITIAPLSALANDGFAKRLTRCLAAAVLLMTVSPPTAAFAAAIASSGLEDIGQKVSDTDLAQMRGKFILPNQVAYFGVQMVTSWQGQDGITTVANLVFTLNLSSGQPSSQILVGWTRQGDPAMDVASSAAPASDNNSAWSTTTGAVQSSVIAGNDNHALNSMRIAALPLAEVHQQVPSGLVPATSSQSESFANGDTLHFVVGSGALGLAIGHGPSSATQMISGDAGRATQAINLVTNNNNVLNDMSMIVGLIPGADLARTQADQAVLAHIGMGH